MEIAQKNVKMNFIIWVDFSGGFPHLKEDAWGRPLAHVHRPEAFCRCKILSAAGTTKGPWVSRTRSEFPQQINTPGGWTAYPAQVYAGLVQRVPWVRGVFSCDATYVQWSLAVARRLSADLCVLHMVRDLFRKIGETKGGSTGVASHAAKWRWRCVRTTPTGWLPKHLRTASASSGRRRHVGT